jgi:hypothetical protein
MAPRLKLSYFAFVLAVLAGVISVLALTAEPEYIFDPPPAITTHEANIGEQRLRLHDGRVVLCLTYGSSAISCDWVTANPSR